MAKLQTYKFVNPGGSSSKSPAVGAARKQTLAINRLGASVSSIQATFYNIGAIALASQKLEDAEAVKARRQKRREADAAAEEASETGKLEKNKKKQKPDSKLKKKGKGLFGDILGKFLGPIGDLFLRIAAIGIITETLKWIGDEENKEKLVTFLEKTKFVFEKLFGFASALVGTFLDGFSALMDPNGDFISKIKGLGQLLVGIIGLRYLMNPFQLIGDILGLMDMMDQDPGLDPEVDPKTKPKPKITDALDETLRKKGLNPEQIQEYRRLRAAGNVKPADALAQAKKFKAPRKGFLGFLQNTGDTVASGFRATGNFAVEQGTRLKDFLINQAKQKYKQLSEAAVNAYANLSEQARKRWEEMVEFTKKAKRQGQQFANGIGEKVNKAGDWVNGKLSKAGEGLKRLAIDEVIKPVRRFVDPIVKQVKQIGDGVMETILKSPAGSAVEGALKKKGLSITKPGPLAKKIGGKALPVIGGLLNALFAYDRFQSGDVVGGLIEALSGAFDISGLFGFVPGPGISLGIDAYMFGRDLVPGIQEFETGLVDAIPGMKALRPKIEEFAKGLPPLSGLFNIFGGQGDLDKQPGPEYDDTAGGQRDLIEPDKEPQEMFLGGIVKGVKKAVGGIGKTLGGIASNPLVQTAASFIPGAGPIMAGIGAISGIASGNPMQMLGSLGGMIPGLGGMMGNIGNAVGGFMNSPLGQIGTSLLSGNFGGAASAAMGMIPGGNKFGGAISSFVNSGFNPIAGVTSLADTFGMGGIMKSVTGMIGGGPQGMLSGMTEIAGELGVNPEALGVVKQVSSQSSKMLGKDGISAQMIMQQAMEFVPVPVVIEKMLPMPQPVPINTGGGGSGVVSAGASGLNSRMN